MLVDLDKDGLLCLVHGIVEPREGTRLVAQQRGYGAYVGQKPRRWVWYRQQLERLPEVDLWAIYQSHHKPYPPPRVSIHNPAALVFCWSPTVVKAMYSNCEELHRDTALDESQGRYSLKSLLQRYMEFHTHITVVGRPCLVALEDHAVEDVRAVASAFPTFDIYVWWPEGEPLDTALVPIHARLKRAAYDLKGRAMLWL